MIGQHLKPSARSTVISTGSRFGLTGPLCTAATILCLGLLLGWAGAALADGSPRADRQAMDACLMEALRKAADTATVGELRAQCARRAAAGDKAPAAGDTEPAAADRQAVGPGPVEERLEADKANVLKPFTLMSHKPNYILLASYNIAGVNGNTYRHEFPDRKIEFYNVETKFQLSIKMPLAVGLFKGRVDIYGAYTNRSFWQLYRTESAPFRETNHEPEVWVQINNDWRIFGFTNKVNAIGLVHQSNGMGGSLSRSWNRIYANMAFERKDLVLSVKPWFRIPEQDVNDDNPDILDYMGWGEIRAAYKYGDNTFSVMVRNAAESGFQRGAVELAWSFPIWKYKFMKGYIQYFTGYGESLIDYDNYSNSIGIGLCLTDWL